MSTVRHGPGGVTTRAYAMPVLVEYLIHDGTDEHPESFVVLRWVYLPPSLAGVPNGKFVPLLPPHAVADTIDEARASLPAGLACDQRYDPHGHDANEDDDGWVLERWY